ncbi:purine nucleoside permease [Fomes fomentarius]|nr:purine nucleoside permease [Fomes fomentarius]
MPFVLASLFLFLLQCLPASTLSAAAVKSRGTGIAPKVFIISMFAPEANVWYGSSCFNILEHNITVPGFSPLFSQANCTRDGSICQLVTGEAEINAASTITALVHSPVFDLTHTYFLIAGIAGISPKLGTIGGVTFAQYAVQVALQYEFDAREKPSEFPTGYVPQGSVAPGQFPQTIAGSEVFEVNANLRHWAVERAKTAKLFDNEQSQQYRANYASNPDFAAGAALPSVVACDTATSDVFWSGNLLATAFENTTDLFTNGTATYCTTQQEDNATLEALLRGAAAGLVDFSRVIIMRTGSNFDRQFDGQAAAENLFRDSLSASFEVALQNIPAAGVPVIEGIVSEWDTRFERGMQPSNYIGDIFGTLGGTPDFGPGSIFN